MTTAIRNLLFGAGVGGASYVYNQAGASQKLPQNAGFVCPAATFAGFLGVAAFACKAALPTRFVWPAVVLAGGGLIMKSLNNSIREIRESREAFERI